MNRTVRLLGLLLGIAVVGWLVAHADFAALAGVFLRLGWGFTVIVAARGATIFVDAGAWYCLMPRRERPRFLTLVPLRWIAESINTTLPAAQVGGDFIRAKLVQRQFSQPARGAATVAVDFALSLFAQILFTLLGFLLLAGLGDGAGWRWAAVSAAIVPVFAFFSWELLVRGRVLAAAIRGLERLGQQRVAVAMRSLGAALGVLAQSRTALGLSLSLHAISFIAHAAELWLTLLLMGKPTGVGQAIMLESLSLLARSAAFLIPSGWGAQEATLIALATVAGLSPDVALALGLVKRAREFVVGLPGLAVWGLAERRAAPPQTA